MPPRKSDPMGRSDTISAQFVLKDDVQIGSSAPALSSARIQTASPATPVAMETDRPSESAPPTDKDKKEGRDATTIEDLTLPKSIITRLAKGVLPPNTQIQTNAVLAMSKSATVFINHLANAANEHTQRANKKTIMPNDVFDALEDIEFPFLRERLEAEFKKFNEVQTTKRNTYRRKVAAAKAGKSSTTDDSAPKIAGTASITQSVSNTSRDPNASTLSAAASDLAATPRSKKQKPNGPDDSQMEVDGENDEERDASDAETEPDQEHDDDEDEEDEEDEEANEDELDDDPNVDIMQEAMEEKDDADDHDEALDDGDSD